MDSQTLQCGYYTNLINEDDLEPTDEVEVEPQVEVEVEPTVKKSCRGSNFTVTDDNMLVEAWLYVTMDAVQGNQQKHKVYWKRVSDYFHEHKTFGSDRNQTSLMNRWSTIQLAVNKFCAFLAQVEKRQQSGLTEQDKIGQARLLYLEVQKSPFHFEHAWLMLRFHPKWVTFMDNVKPKKKPVVINLGDDEASPEALQDLERPIGRKAEKEKRKSKDKTNPGVVVILNDMNEDKKKKMKMFEEAREQDKEMFTLKKEEVRLKQDELRLRERTLRLKEERAIQELMLMDTSQLDEDGQEYVRRRKKAILEGNP
ncbi:hypothetical protein SLA2020_269250 [Shorea laevis]